MSPCNSSRSAPGGCARHADYQVSCASKHCPRSYSSSPRRNVASSQLTAPSRFLGQHDARVGRRARVAAPRRPLERGRRARADSAERVHRRELQAAQRGAVGVAEHRHQRPGSRRVPNLSERPRDGRADGELDAEAGAGATLVVAPLDLGRGDERGPARPQADAPEPHRGKAPVLEAAPGVDVGAAERGLQRPRVRRLPAQAERFEHHVLLPAAREREQRRESERVAGVAERPQLRERAARERDGGAVARAGGKGGAVRGGGAAALRAERDLHPLDDRRRAGGGARVPRAAGHGEPLGVAVARVREDRVVGFAVGGSRGSGGHETLVGGIGEARGAERVAD